MKNKVENLLKNDEQITPKPTGVNTEYKYTKSKLKKICASLSIENNYYQPKKTIVSIQTYLSSDKSLSRILYSEISNYIFSLDYGQIGTLASNLDALITYTMNPKNKLDSNCAEMVLRIYDHCQLAIHQVENVRDVFSERAEQIKENLEVDIKEIEKEYITILGIFAAIVLAFVGGIAFSTSVLKYMSDISIFRLVLVIDLLGLILISIIYLLIRFIMQINNKYFFDFEIKWLYIITFIIAVADIVVWALSANKIASFLNTYIPWG